MTEIKIDAATLPTEERQVDILLKDADEWKRGLWYVVQDQLFWASPSEFYSAWDVLYWIYEDENK